MAFAKRFKIKEDITTLRKELRRSKSEMVSKRLRALILFKKHEETGISKSKVADLLGIDTGSALKWRNAYINGGLAGMLAHGRKGNRPSVIKPHQREVLGEKLHDAGNGLRGFTELLAWFNAHFTTEVKYQTMNKYVKRNYGALCKTARAPSPTAPSQSLRRREERLWRVGDKSHLKKDPEAVAAFKKKL